MSALSVPLLNSLTNFPETESQIRTKVPLMEVVASNRPEGGIDRLVKADVCAIIIDTGCFEGGGGGFRGGDDDGGPLGAGTGHGGRCTSCT